MTEGRDKLNWLETKVCHLGEPAYPEFHAQFVQDQRDGLTAREQAKLHLTRAARVINPIELVEECATMNQHRSGKNGELNIILHFSTC